MDVLKSLVLVGACGVLALAGCNHNGQKSASAAEDESQCKMVKPGAVTTVNKVCAVVHEDPVNPEVEPAVWKGQKVGFCCNGCKPKWEKMSPAEKDAALAAAMAAPVPGQ